MMEVWSQVNKKITYGGKFIRTKDISICACDIVSVACLPIPDLKDMDGCVWHLCIYARGREVPFMIPYENEDELRQDYNEVVLFVDECIR